MTEYESSESLISEAHESNKPPRVKLLTPKKWKNYMLDVLHDLKTSQQAHELLLIDLMTIITSISDASFLEATLQIRPFKPEFIHSQTVLVNRTLSTLAETITNTARCRSHISVGKDEVKKREKISEGRLHKEFSRPYHPFKFIIKNFRRLIELKYKSRIDKGKAGMEQIVKDLNEDFRVLAHFLREAALPYHSFFKVESHKEQSKVVDSKVVDSKVVDSKAVDSKAVESHKEHKEHSKVVNSKAVESHKEHKEHSKAAVEKLKSFVEGYVKEEAGVLQSIKKVLVYASRAQFSALVEQKIRDHVVVEDFDIPQEFRIDGCYIHSINSLMEFTSGSDPVHSLTQLYQLRNNILKDLQEYSLAQKGHSQHLQVCAEVQIEIIRFLLAKLKGWACQIYGQMKFLELFYGQDELAFRFEEASFIFAQLSLAFEIEGIH